MTVSLPIRPTFRQSIHVNGPTQVAIGLTFPIVQDEREAVGSYRIELDWKGVPETELVANPYLKPVELSRPYYFHVALRERLVVSPGGGGPASRPIQRIVHNLEILLVLLRGVKVEIRKGGQDDLDAFLERFVELTVIRVQDVTLVPPLGQTLDRDSLLPTYNAIDVLEFPPKTSAANMKIKRGNNLANIVVRHIPNGIQLQWLLSGQVLEIVLEDPLSDKSGFSFGVNLAMNVGKIDTEDALRYAGLVSVKITGGVKVSASYLNFNTDDPVRKRIDRVLLNAATTPRKELRFYCIERVKQLRDLPIPTDPCTCKTHDESIKVEVLDPDILSKVAIDMVIGSIPIVGDLIEIGEFFYAYRTGEDKYGDKVTSSQLALMGVGALLPAVGSGVLRLARKGSSPGMLARLERGVK